MNLHKTTDNNKNHIKKNLNAYSLAGIGIGGIIGAGFFLGSSLAINQAGPSVIIAFLFGGLIMSQVLGAMTSISINRPVRGSFKVYTDQFLGKFLGFLLGWIIFISGVLSISSEAIAAGIFLRFWFPHISSAVFALIIMLLVIAINRLSTKKFGYIESAMSVAKITLLILFILIGGYFIISHGVTARPNPFYSFKAFFPNNISGFLQSILIVVFTYSGISTVAMATSEVKNPEVEIPKATVLLTIGIVSLYILSMIVIVSITGWKLINVNISPFVQTFSKIGYLWASAVVNAVVLIATISVMAGSYFGCIQVILSLADTAEAPAFMKNKTSHGFYRNAWILTAVSSLLVVAAAFIAGTKLFNYLVSSCSYFSFFNWIINLITYLIWLKHRHKDEKYDSPLIFGRTGAYSTIIIIILLFFISLRVPDFRMGFYAAAVLSIIVSFLYKFTVKKA